MENKEPSKKTNLSKSDNDDSKTGPLNDSFTQIDDSNAPTASPTANCSSSVPNSANLSLTPHSTIDDSSNETLPNKDQSKAFLAESKSPKVLFSVDYILNVLSTKHVPDEKSSQNGHHHQNDIDKKHLLNATNNSWGATSNVGTLENYMIPENKGQISSKRKSEEFEEKLQNPISSHQVC